MPNLEEVVDGTQVIGQPLGALGQASDDLLSTGVLGELFESLAGIDRPALPSDHAPRLPDPLQPFEDESLLGLICRYAGEIGMEVSRKVLAPIDLDHLSHRRMANRTHDAQTSEAVRILLGLDEKTFARLCPLDGVRTRTFGARSRASSSSRDLHVPVFLPVVPRRGALPSCHLGPHRSPGLSAARDGPTRHVRGVRTATTMEQDVASPVLSLDLWCKALLPDIRREARCCGCRCLPTGRGTGP